MPLDKHRENTGETEKKTQEKHRGNKQRGHKGIFEAYVSQISSRLENYGNNHNNNNNNYKNTTIMIIIIILIITIIIITIIKSI
jgi:hypothetical protein